VVALLRRFEAAIEREPARRPGLHLVRPFAGGLEDGARNTRSKCVRWRRSTSVACLSRPGSMMRSVCEGNWRFAGLRLGPPVKRVRRNGEWRGKLRIGLSMPQIVRLCASPADETAQRLRQDISMIAERLVMPEAAAATLLNRQTRQLIYISRRILAIFANAT